MGAPVFDEGGELTTFGWARVLVERVGGMALGTTGESIAWAVYKRGLRGEEATEVAAKELEGRASCLAGWAGTDPERRAAAESAVALGGWRGLAALIGWGAA